MADSPRGRSSRSPSPWQGNSRSRSRSRSRPRSPSRSRSRSGSRGRDATNPGNTLYVTGLSTRVTERDLEDHFSREGKVISCRLVVEPRTRISRGFAFVTMGNLEDADRCIKHLNQSVLEGRYITVEKVFDYSEDIASAMLAAIKDDEFIHLNLSHTGLISGQLNSFSHASDQLNIGNSPTTKQPQHSPSTLSTNQRTLPTTLSNQAFMSRRKRPRTPTPGNYLGLKSSRESSYRGDRGRYRGGYGRDDYGYRRSPRRSPYRGGRDYSPRRSPYGGRSRRERSRSLPYSPYGSPERGYGRRANAYAR